MTSGRRRWRLILAWFVMAGVGALADGARAATPDILSGPYIVAYDSSQQVIEVIGPFGPGIAEALRVQLNEHADVKAVHLSSPGGLVIEGRRMRDLIYSRRLDTYVRTFCVSACTLAFIGGGRRIVHRNAIIGFHQYGGFPGESLRDHWQDDDRSYFRGRGVAYDFVDKMFQAKHKELWQLTADQAVAAKVATEATDLFDAAPESLYPEYVRQAFETGKNAYQQLYAALQRYEPESYRESVAMAFDAALTGDSTSAAAQAGILTGATLYERLLPTTSYEAAHAVAGAFIALLTDLRDSSPAACVAVMTAESGMIPAEDDFDAYRPATMRQLASAYVAVIRDAHERPQPKMSDGAVEDALLEFDRLFDASEIADDREFLANTKKHRLQPDRACGLYIKMFALLANEPAEQGGRQMKALLAE